MSYLKKDLRKDLSVEPNENVYDIKSRIIDKCKAMICPRDGELGAAYVDLVHSRNPQDAGASQCMLSYTWGQRVEVIVETLVQYCNRVELDLDNTAVWICFAW